MPLVWWFLHRELDFTFSNLRNLSAVRNYARLKGKKDNNLFYLFLLHFSAFLFSRNTHEDTRWISCRPSGLRADGSSGTGGPERTQPQPGTSARRPAGRGWSPFRAWRRWQWSGSQPAATGEKMQTLGACRTENVTRAEQYMEQMWGYGNMPYGFAYIYLIIIRYQECILKYEVKKCMGVELYK